MKRFIAYILLALSVFLGIGATFVPVATNINADLSFKDGKKFTYQLVNRDESDLENDENANKDMAAIMESRLQTWGVSDYKIETVGNDIIDVTLAAASVVEYDYIKNYLSFSANFSIATTDDEFSFYSDDEKYPFEDSKAYITYNGVIPVLVMPIKNQTDFQGLVDHGTEIESGGEDEEESTVTTSIVIWNNRIEGEDLYEDREKNPNVSEKIFLELSASNIYYSESEGGNSAIQYQFVPNTTDPNGGVSVSEVTAAYNKALYTLNCWNAGQTKYECDFLYENPVSASSENLIVYGDRATIAMSQLFIATVICFAIISLILVLFYRVAAIGIIANTSATTYITFLFFVLFGVQFNIAAVIGLILVAAITLFTGIMYQNKFHEEIYKGRNYKKANSEAGKKMTMVNIDTAVVSAIIGLFTFIFGGSAVSSLGAILIIGAIASLISELVIHRSSMWLLSNTTSLQNKHSWFNVDGNKVPDILKEEKATYVAPYSTSNPTKHKKVFAISSLVVAVASLVGMIVFNSISGSIYNQPQNTNAGSEIVLVVDAKNSTIEDIKYVKDVYLANIKNAETGEAISYKDVTVNERSIYNEDIEENVDYNYFVITLDEKYDDKALFTYTIDGSVSSQMSLESVIESYTNAIDTTAEGTYKYVASYNVKSYNLSYGIAAAISLAVACVYIGVRYRASRGVAVFTLGSVNSIIVMGFFSLTRIPVTDIVTTAIFAGTLLTVLVSLFVLSKEKELLKEEKTRSLSIRNETILKALKVSIYPIIIYTLTMSYIAINFFGFGASTSAYLFFAVLIAILINIVFMICLFVPLANIIETLFSKIKLPKIERRNKKPNKKKKSSSEPQEAIFIGIND